MSANDPQLKNLYRWEGSNGWDVSNASFKKAKDAIIFACSYFSVSAPEIKLHKNRNLPFSIPDKMVIGLQRDRYLNVPIALHEASHHIAWHLFGSRIQDHGPTFLGIYLHLLETVEVDTRVALRTSARAHKLKWRTIIPRSLI